MKLFAELKNSFKADHDAAFFGRNDNGEIIFYPWGTEGEGIIVTEEQAAHVTIFMRIFTGLFVLSGVFLVTLDMLTQPKEAFFLLPVMFLIPAYVVAVYYLQKDKNFYLPSMPQRFKRLHKLFWLFLVVVGYVSGVLIFFGKGFIDGGSAFSFSWAAIVFIVLFTLGFLLSTYLFIKIWRAQGCFFHDNCLDG